MKYGIKIKRRDNVVFEMAIKTGNFKDAFEEYTHFCRAFYVSEARNPGDYAVFCMDELPARPSRKATATREREKRVGR